MGSYPEKEMGNGLCLPRRMEWEDEGFKIFHMHASINCQFVINKKDFQIQDKQLMTVRCAILLHSFFGCAYLQPSYSIIFFFFFFLVVEHTSILG